MEQTQDQEKKETAFQRWYRVNGKTYNEQRRKRYHEDEAYRNKQLAGTRGWRQRTRQNSSVSVDGPVRFSIGETAEKVGRDIQTIRSWEKKGYIPRTDDGHGYRVYTQHQIDLMIALSGFLAQYAGQSPKFKASEQYKAIVQDAVNQLKEQWGANGSQVGQEG